MIEVEVHCRGCATMRWVDISETTLHCPAQPGGIGELEFVCRLCGASDRIEVGAETVASLSLLGARTRPLHDPALEAGHDAGHEAGHGASRGETLNWDDLLEWHECLNGVDSVAPWE